MGALDPLKPDAGSAQTTSAHWWDPGYGYKKTATGTVYTNPAGLGETLGRTQIQGVWDILGGAKQLGRLQGPLEKISGTGWGDYSSKPQVTADQAMWLFQHATTPAQLAVIQQKLYFAGLYGNHLPTLGVFQKSDKDAFRKMLIGLASSPEQGAAGGYLDAISQGAGLQGPKRAPLVVKLSSPDELRSVFQAVAQKIEGQFLPSAEVDQMVATYQQMQTKAQTDAYNMGDSSLTGVLDGGAGGTVTTPPAADAFAETQIKGAHPEQVGATQFGSLVQQSLDSLRSSGYLR